MTVSRKNALTFIFITILIDVIGIGIIIPVVPKLIEQLTGEGLSEASRYGGWLIFSYAVMQFLFSPIIGNLSDRYGRRPVLLLSLAGLGLDYILSAVAPTIFWLFIGRLIAGVMGASFTTAKKHQATFGFFSGRLPVSISTKSSAERTATEGKGTCLRTLK